MNSHTEKQIDRFVGAVRLNLPKSLHLGLVDLLNKELGSLPPQTGAFVKENCIAAVALAMRQSKTDSIYQAEAERRERDAQVIQEAEKHVRLAEAKQRNIDIVEFIESALFTRSLRPHIIDHSFRAFCEQVASDRESLLLIEWATNLLEKRRELFG